MSNEQIEFCEAIVTDLRRLFPYWPPLWFSTNAETAPVGRVTTITVPADVARQLLDKYAQT